MSDIEIRTAELADWQVAKDIRLRALADSPIASVRRSPAKQHSMTPNGRTGWRRDLVARLVGQR